MKQLKNYLFVLGILFFSFNGYAQKDTFASLPVKERDSILMAIAKEAILIYGPGYYREYNLPEIKYKGPWGEKDKNNGRIFYRVRYSYNKGKEDLLTGFAASVFVWADTRDAFRIYFGNAVIVNFDGVDYRKAKVKVNPYQQRKDMPPPPNFNNLDDPNYTAETRDSVLRFLGKEVLKKYAPDYKVDYQTPVIKLDSIEQALDENGCRFYRLTYGNGVSTREYPCGFIIQVDIWAKGKILRRVATGKGIEVEQDKDIRIQIGRKRDIHAPANFSYDSKWYGRFLIPLLPGDLSLKKNRVPINLDDLPVEERDSILLRSSKEYILAVGPKYYREYQLPHLDSTKVDVGDGRWTYRYQERFPTIIRSSTWERSGKNKGRKYYNVVYGRSHEAMYMNESAIVGVWADTGDVFTILFGNGTRVTFDGLDYQKLKEIVPYQGVLPTLIR